MSRVSSSFLRSPGAPAAAVVQSKLATFESTLSAAFSSLERFSFSSLSSVDQTKNVSARASDLTFFLLRHKPKGRAKRSFTSEYRIYSSDLSLLLSSPLTAQSTMHFNVSNLFSLLSLSCSESADPLASPASTPSPFVFLLQFSLDSEFHRFRECWIKFAWESARNESFDAILKSPEDYRALLASASNPALTSFILPESKQEDEDNRMPIDDDMEFLDEPGKVIATPKSASLAQPFNSPEPGRRSAPARRQLFDVSDSDSEAESESASDESADEKYSETPKSKIVRSRAGPSKRTPAAASLESNDNLAVGITKLNRTYVGRGTQLGVFRHDDEGQLEYLTRIPTVMAMDGSAISASQLMLHENDRKLLILNPSDTSKVHVFDIEAEKVVAEMTGQSKTNTDFDIRSIAPVKKYAEATSEQLFYGINGNSVFSMDPRLRGNSSISQMNEYKTKLNNNCIVSTGSGNVAVTTSKGEIRLYDDISKRAKSLIPGLGDAIIGIDVTEDGVWIAATTKTYILLIKTEFADAKGNGKSNKSGWNSSLINSESNNILKLQLNPLDLVRYGIEEISFTQARFNIGENILERWLVCSTGPFIITWNLRRVQQGKLFDYKLKKCQSDVVADSFIFDRQDQIMVTLPDQVFVEKRGIKQKQ